MSNIEREENEIVKIARESRRKPRKPKKPVVVQEQDTEEKLGLQQQQSDKYIGQAIPERMERPPMGSTLQIAETASLLGYWEK